MPDPHFDPARLDAAQSNKAQFAPAEYDPEHQQRKRHWAWAISVAVLMALVIVGLNLWQRSPAPAPQSTTPTPTPAPTPVPMPAPEAVIENPVVENPVVPTNPPTPLPALADSDTVAQQALAGLLGSALVRESLNTDQLVRRIVATVDNLTRAKMTQRQSPLKPVAGQFTVTPSNSGAAIISPDNAKRYEPWVQAFSRLDMRQVAGLYRQFYPLFQSAYEELGYPKAYFNDRLIAVIDHLLATPQAPAAAALVQPKVLYEYADPEWEARSAGQKILLRMSPAQAAKVKAKLKELREQVAAQKAPPPQKAPLQ